MEAEDPPALHAWEWKLRAGKAMEMGVKRDKKHWMAAQDDRVVRCECSCDREELLMVLLGPMTAGICYANIRSFSSNAFAAKNCNIITAMALL